MSANDWPEVSLIELQAPSRWALNGGPFGSKLVSRDYVDAGVPVIRGVNLPNSQRFSFDDFVFVSEDKADELLPNNAHPGDVVFTQRGTLGQVGIIPRCSPYSRFVISQSQMKITVDKGRVDPYWLFYAFRNPVIQQEMINRASTSGVPHINLAVLREFKLRLPPVQTQLRIASILSAYDDLIENNTRRIAILEEMARRIYEEWFVRFRFPGHENVRMVESELGLVPEGWRIATLGAVCEYINRGLAPRYADDAPGIVINQKCIRDQRLSLAEARRQCKPVPKEKIIRLGDVLINSTGVGTLGRVAQVLESLESCTVDTHVSIVRASSDMDRDFFGLTMLAKQAHFEGQGVGSTGQTELSRGRIAETSILLPSKQLQEQFGKMVSPMRLLVVRLQAQNTNLRATRDLLLPKLISGELDVSALPEPEVCIT